MDIQIIYDGVDESGMVFHNMVSLVDHIDKIAPEIENLQNLGFYNLAVAFGDNMYYLVDHSVEDICSYIAEDIELADRVR